MSSCFLITVAHRDAATASLLAASSSLFTACAAAADMHFSMHVYRRFVADGPAFCCRQRSGFRVVGAELGEAIPRLRPLVARLNSCEDVDELEISAVVVLSEGGEHGNHLQDRAANVKSATRKLKKGAGLPDRGRCCRLRVAGAPLLECHATCCTLVGSFAIGATSRTRCDHGSPTRTPDR